MFKKPHFAAFKILVVNVSQLPALFAVTSGTAYFCHFSNCKCCFLKLFADSTVTMSGGGGGGRFPRAFLFFGFIVLRINVCDNFEANKFIRSCRSR